MSSVTNKKSGSGAARSPEKRPGKVTSAKAAAPRPVTSKTAPPKAMASKTAPPAKAQAAKPAELARLPAKPAAMSKPAPKGASPAKDQAAAPAKVAPVAPRKLEFKAGDFVVYPTHGVGRIQRISEQEVAGSRLELFEISFDKDKMILRVPTSKARAVGMRKLSTPDVVATALNTLKGRARIKRTMWSRRAQEYEAKINSGDLVSIAEVVRDLHRAGGQPEQSYSERQLYEAALARMAREVAAIERIDEQAAVKRVEGALVKKAA